MAAVLETAAALGGSPSVTNAVRFAFWGAGEVGERGRRNYVAGLERRGLADIALYLDFDMLGSRNAGYFTYDGDQSGVANPEVPAASVPAGVGGHRAHAGGLPEPRGHPARRRAAWPDR